MFRTRRRYLVFIVTALFPLATLAVGIYLRVSRPNAFVIGALLLVVLALSSFSAYYIHIKPLRELSSATTVLLESVGQRIIELASAEGVQARLNYLAIFRPVKYIFFSRYFRVAWGIGMRYQPDNTMRFHVSKGVAGKAVRTRRSIFVNQELPENRNYGGFSDEELGTFPPLTAIWSFPVFELDRSGNATGTILGTINLDSETHGAWEVFMGNQEYGRLLEEFRDLVSKVVSC